MSSSPTLTQLAQLAQHAGRVTLGYWQSTLTVVDKSGDAGIVTNADLASEKLIKAFIENHFPDHSILAEESGWKQEAASGNGGDARPVWIIDPLDGTTNFSRGNAYYCVSIAFGYQTTQGCEITLGAIYQPTTNTLFLGQKGQGAWRNGVPMTVEPLNHLKRGSFCTGFSRNKNADLRQVIESLFIMQNHSLGTRINGAAALDMALTAAGVFHGFYEKALSPWDTAAGVLFMREAGARVTNFHGQEFDCLRDENLIAAHPETHSRLSELLIPVFR